MFCAGHTVTVGALRGHSDCTVQSLLQNGTLRGKCTVAVGSPPGMLAGQCDCEYVARVCATWITENVILFSICN